ncbi:DNA-directed RNA polymerase subunit delta [Tumebacillus permanentifrigoris]|uniref:Probable DNA-directed RNA polymerase subunit delta n=1 Tax=Tumebacillus permanentifrigoris TaxID=378543 RepID=A0A316D4L8_9BACL|nr:DNA-directed RNA polymerase subunit delta [Tumebacillus permanentifrigoris]PWK07859.1 DNA-directed RNA polymerase subunit delta [Tumebacillus permanentifrigoris]
MAEAHAVKLDPEKVSELSLVDLAFVILKQTNKPFLFSDLMQTVARLKGLTPTQINEVIARLYTEINIDGRFICIGNNTWGLKRWYPTDKAPEKSSTSGKKFVRKDIDEDDDDFYDDEEEESYDDEDAEVDTFAAAFTAVDDDADAADEEEEEFEGEVVEVEETEEAEEEEFDSYEEDEEF